MEYAELHIQFFWKSCPFVLFYTILHGASNPWKPWLFLNTVFYLGLGMFLVISHFQTCLAWYWKVLGTDRTITFSYRNVVHRENGPKTLVFSCTEYPNWCWFHVGSDARPNFLWVFWNYYSSSSSNVPSQNKPIFSFSFCFYHANVSFIFKCWIHHPKAISKLELSHG